MSQHVAAFRSHNLFLPRHARASFLHSCWLLHVSGWAGTAKLRATRVARASVNLLEVQKLSAEKNRKGVFMLQSSFAQDRCSYLSHDVHVIGGTLIFACDHVLNVLL